MEVTYPVSRRTTAHGSPIQLLVLSATIAIAVAAALVALPGFIGGGTAQSFADRSYDQVEKVRSQVVLPNLAADHSYDDIEHIRSQFIQVKPSNRPTGHRR